MVILGLQTCSALHPCPWCDTTKDMLHVKGNQRTFNSIQESFKKWQTEGKSNKAKAKDFGSNYIFFTVKYIIEKRSREVSNLVECFYTSFLIIVCCLELYTLRYLYVSSCISYLYCDSLIGNCINEPLITTDNDVPILSYVPIPELHILIGITTYLFKLLEHENGQLAENWLANLNIQLSHRGQFNGNGARQLLKNVEKLENLDPGKVLFFTFEALNE